MRGDHRHGHRHGGLQEVDHLLVGQGAHGVLADLHQPASLSETRLPGVAKVLDLGDEAVVLDVEAELTKLVSTEAELLSHGPGADGLETGGDLGHVVGFPVLGVHDHTLALKKFKIKREHLLKFD